MKKYKDIRCPLYSANFKIIVDENLKSTYETIRKITKNPSQEIEGEKEKKEDVWCAVFWPTKNEAVIYFKKIKNKDFFDINIVSHEVFHAVYGMLKNKGIFLCDKSEEVFAYYTGWLTEKIFTYLNSILMSSLEDKKNVLMKKLNARPNR